MKKITIMSFLLVSSMSGIAAEDNLWDEDLEGDWGEETADSNWSGFLEYGIGIKKEADDLFETKQTLNEARLYLENEWDNDGVSLNLKGEIWHDLVLSESKLNFRELSLSFSMGNNTDVKIGRQISTWGTGDLVFLNDQFPKDWQGYFNGRDDNYIKAAANALRIQNYNEWADIDLIWTPKFTPDDYINGERLSFFSSIARENIGGTNQINAEEPKSKLANGEIALRLSKNVSGTELSVYAYKGFDKRPLGATEEFRPTHHKRNLYGASVRGAIAGGLYNMEIIQENALEDSNGRNPLVNNSLQKYLIGYESEWLPKLNVSFQYYIERILNYDEMMAVSFAPEFEAPKYRRWLTNRVRYQALQDKLTINLFSFFSISEDEYFLRWNANYRHDDNWSYTAGINLIDGKEAHTFFNQFHLASNAYLRVRYNF